MLGASIFHIAVCLMYHPKERYTVLSRRIQNRRIRLPSYFWDNYCNPQSYKKHSLLASCSLLYVTYGICSRQGELTDRRLVESEGQSPVFSIFLSLIHLTMPNPHRLEVGFLSSFQTPGRDNPNKTIIPQVVLFVKRLTRFERATSNLEG